MYNNNATHLQMQVNCIKNIGVISMKSTKARKDILEILERYDFPLNAEEVYEILDEDYDKSTIYRNLKRFEKDGTIKSIVFSDKIKYFYKIEGHFHFIYCIKCKKFEKFDICYSESMSQYLKEKLGYQIISHTLYFEGICKDCQKSSS